MGHTIWDAVIHNYNIPRVEDVAHFVGADSDMGKKVIEIILFFILDSYKEREIGLHIGTDPDKAKERIETFLGLVQSASNLLAMDIMETICPILLAFPSFTLGTDASCISGGMMLADEDIVDNNPLADGIIYEILYPNLFGVLSLEAIGQKAGSDAFLTLAEFKRKYGPKETLSLGQGIKPAHLPEGLRNLFVVERKSENTNSPYQIGTNFPELLYAILENIRTSPLSQEPKTSNSLPYSKVFYDECVKAILSDGVWSEKSLAEFYLFERIFRLNAKFSLACYEHNSKGEFVLSPELLRDFFFHSPLVIFPPKLLGLFYEKAAKYTVQQVAKQFLHFLIQLSAYWFPCILSIIRAYMQEKKIQSFDDVCQFFFLESKYFKVFMESYTQNLQKLPSYEKFFPEKGCAKRRARDTFSKRWNEFQPNPFYRTEAYAPLLLSDWRNMLYRCYSDLSDSEAAKSILLTLP